MKPRGVKLIKGKEPILRQLIFELRYRYGFTYLDKCGKILNRIARDHPQWIIGNEVSPQSAPLYSSLNGCRFSLSANRLDFNLDKTTAEEGVTEEEIGQFAEQVGDLTQVVIDELELGEFQRQGFRALYFFPCDSKDETEAWIKRLGAFTVSESVYAAFGKDFEAASLAVVLAGPECRFRVAFTGVEISAQIKAGQEIVGVRARDLNQGQRAYLMKKAAADRAKKVNAGYAAVIDIDAYLEDPPSVDPRDFVMIHAGTVLEKIRTALAE